jgi:hypothetical protein
MSNQPPPAWQPPPPPPAWQQQAPPPGYQPQQQKKKSGLPQGCLIALVVVAVLVALLIIAAIAGGGKDDTSSSNEGASSEQDLFPGRPDEKRGDKERVVGQAAELSGYTVTLASARFQPALSMFEDNGYLVAAVDVLNRDDQAQPYNTFEWKLITPGGTIIDPYFGGQQLGSGDLAQGGRKSGNVIWEVAGQRGDFYVIYDPLDTGSDRAVWKVTL